MSRFVTAVRLVGALLWVILDVSCGEYEVDHTPAKARFVSASGELDNEASRTLCLMQGLGKTCDVCATSGWYADATCDVFCPNPDPDCADLNLLANGNFDADLDGWNIKGLVTSVAGGFAGYGAQIAPASGIAQDVAAAPGTYVLSGYLRSSGMSGNDFWLGGYCYDSDWNPIPTINGFYGTPAGDYHYYSASFRCAPGTVLVRVFLGDQSSGTVIADAVVLATVSAP